LNKNYDIWFYFVLFLFCIPVWYTDELNFFFLTRLEQSRSSVAVIADDTALHVR